jgi:hypothetical protein
MARPICRRPADHFAGAHVPAKETLQVVPYPPSTCGRGDNVFSQSTGEVLMGPNRLKA